MNDTLNRQIDFRVRRMESLGVGDAEDLTNDIWAAILRAMPSFDPLRASAAHFARVVADYFFKYTMRSHNRQRERQKAFVHLSRVEGWQETFGGDSRWEEREYELAEEMWERLSVGDRELLVAVHESSVTDVAEELGLHKGNVSRRVNAIYGEARRKAEAIAC